MDDVQAWAASPVRDEMRRVLVELPDGIDKVEMIELARAMIGGVRAVAPEPAPALLHAPQPRRAVL